MCKNEGGSRNEGVIPEDRGKGHRLESFLNALFERRGEAKREE